MYKKNLILHIFLYKFLNLKNSYKIGVRYFKT